MNMAGLVANAVGENSEVAEMVTIHFHSVLLKVRGEANSIANIQPGEMDEMLTNFGVAFDLASSHEIQWHLG
jgi:hypothetical protein